MANKNVRNWRKHLPADLPKEKVSFFKGSDYSGRTTYSANFDHPLATPQYFACLSGVEFEGKIYVGLSFCNPQDKWNKKIARNVAIGRALKALATHRVNVIFSICPEPKWTGIMEKEALKTMIKEAKRREYNSFDSLKELFLMHMNMDQTKDTK